MNTPAILPKRILVVDDEACVIDAVKMMLKLDGHTVETASSGQEALALYQQAKFDLVITDFSLPGMTGNDLANQLKARNPKQPIVMITAYAELLAANQTPMDAGDCTLSKPFSLGDLRAALAKAIATK